MNAVFREEYEVPVISNDAIQAQLIHLRDGLQEVRSSQTVLQGKIDKTNERVDAVNATLSAKIDALKSEIFARFDKQSEEIKDLAKGVAWVHISVKVVLAILGLCVSAAVILNTLRALDWI